MRRKWSVEGMEYYRHVVANRFLGVALLPQSSGVTWHAFSKQDTDSTKMCKLVNTIIRDKCVVKSTTMTLLNIISSLLPDIGYFLADVKSFFVLKK